MTSTLTVLPQQATTQKARPADQERRNASTGNIVMNAAEATLLRGRITVVADALSPASKMLRIDGGMTTAPTVVYPPHTDCGRNTKGTTEFTLKTQSTNPGVLLRRKLDYSFPNQRAEVFVAPGTLRAPLIRISNLLASGISLAPTRAFTLIHVASSAPRSIIFKLRIAVFATMSFWFLATLRLVVPPFACASSSLQWASHSSPDIRWANSHGAKFVTTHTAIH